MLSQHTVEKTRKSAMRQSCDSRRASAQMCSLPPTSLQRVWTFPTCSRYARESEQTFVANVNTSLEWYSA